MDDLVDVLLDKETAASDISDKMKDLLFAKAAGRVDGVKPDIAASMFSNNNETEVETEPQNEVDQEPEEEPNE